MLKIFSSQVLNTRNCGLRIVRTSCFGLSTSDFVLPTSDFQLLPNCDSVFYNLKY